MSIEADSPRGIAGSEAGRRVRTFFSRVEGRLKLGLAKRTVRYGLRRDLTVPIERPSAKIPISVREVRQEDLAVLLPEDTSTYSEQDRLEIVWRKRFAADVGSKGCYVAIDERDGSPCYMQWLLAPSQNEVIRRLGGFPQLQKGEALLENAYTPPTHRGLGIMSAAMALIAERGEDVNARYVITFVGEDNIASLKGCRRAGFAPDMLHIRQDYLFGIVRRHRFEPLPADDPRRNWEL